MDILGSNYELVQDSSLLKKGLDGCCIKYRKQIRVLPTEKMLDDKDNYEEKQKRYNEVLRHEMVHAFFNESGLDKYSDDEILVDWIAMQFPKMFKLFKEYQCLE